LQLLQFVFFFFLWLWGFSGRGRQDLCKNAIFASYLANFFVPTSIVHDKDSLQSSTHATFSLQMICLKFYVWPRLRHWPLIDITINSKWTVEFRSSTSSMLSRPRFGWRRNWGEDPSDFFRLPVNEFLSATQRKNCTDESSLNSDAIKSVRSLAKCYSWISYWTYNEEWTIHGLCFKLADNKINVKCISWLRKLTL
jgi:hypothetical protein